MHRRGVEEGKAVMLYGVRFCDDVGLMLRGRKTPGQLGSACFAAEDARVMRSFHDQTRRSSAERVPGAYSSECKDIATMSIKRALHQHDKHMYGQLPPRHTTNGRLQSVTFAPS